MKETKRTVKTEDGMKELVCPQLTVAFQEETWCLGTKCIMFEQVHTNVHKEIQGYCSL
jgi:hypothetical protein